MRIVIDMRFLSVPGTGVASYAEGLIDGIVKNKIPPEDEYVFLIPQGFDVQKRDIKFETCNTPVVTIQQHLLMPFYLLKAKPDVYHYPHFDLPFAFNTVSVITIHDLKYIKMPDLFYRKSKGKSLLMRTTMRNSIRRARKVITVSKSTKEDIVNVLKVPPYKIEVIYEACDSCYRVAPGLTDFVIKKYNIQLPFLLFVGEIRPHKNLSRLLKAFKQVKYKDYYLIIVGRNYLDYKEPFKLVEKLGIQNRVKFLKFVPKKDLVHIYNAATVFILPSLYEGFGIPVLEAMACGIPVITSNVSSLPEVAGDSALLIDPYDVESMTDAIDRVLGSSSLQQRMREKGLKWVKEFSWSKAARETIKVYREAYNEKKN